MTSSHTETPPAVGISVSESPDLRALGLSDGHLRDAMAGIALHLLASGRSLAFGGEWTGCPDQETAPTRDLRLDTRPAMDRGHGLKATAD